MIINNKNTRTFIVEGYKEKCSGHEDICLAIDNFVLTGDISYLKGTIYYDHALKEFKKENDSPITEGAD